MAVLISAVVPLAGSSDTRKAKARSRRSVSASDAAPIDATSPALIGNSISARGFHRPRPTTCHAPTGRVLARTNPGALLPQPQQGQRAGTPIALHRETATDSPL